MFITERQRFTFLYTLKAEIHIFAFSVFPPTKEIGRIIASATEGNETIRALVIGLDWHCDFTTETVHF